MPTAGPDEGSIVLNPEQREAVEHFEGPALVLAGAGSGKTRVLTTRVCRLIDEHGVPPHRIMAVTFTNKAAGEMRERVAALLDREPRGIWLGTFHALGARMLRRHAPTAGMSRTFSILDAEQSLRQVKRAATEAGVDTKRWRPKALRGYISDAKNQLVGSAEFEERHGLDPDPTLRNAARAYPAYQAALREQNAVDFDDLLMRPVRLLEGDAELLARYRDQFAFVLVDEYQDTNRAQFRLLELLAGPSGNLMVVGDDDQSIYGWRGADIRNILDFEKSFPAAKVVRLEQNYRSTPVILSAANAVIRQNCDRKPKTLRTERRGGAPVTRLEAADEIDEAAWTATEVERRMLVEPRLDHRDFAVLYRTNAQARAMEDGFRRRGVPYQIVGGVRFYERREVQDVLAYLRLLSNYRDRDAFHRVVNYPTRGVGRVTLERLTDFATAQSVTLLQAAAAADMAPGIPPSGRRGLAAFAELIRTYSAKAAQLPVGPLLEELVSELDLMAVLNAEGPEGEDRADNVRELVAGAMEFVAEVEDREEPEDREGFTDRDAFTDLDVFLQQVALVADVDRHDPGADAVTLMTLHSAKGLEFPVVFISGMEEGLFPLARSYDEPRLLEEERRLFYVGVTRAREKLYLTHARRRRRAGDVNFGALSSFADVLASELEVKTTSQVPARPPARRQRGWEDRSASSESRRDGSRAARWDDRRGNAEDDDFDQDRPSYRKGEGVVHETFGSGTIAELAGFGRDLKVVVDFPHVGRKKLLVRYAGLRRDYF